MPIMKAVVGIAKLTGFVAKKIYLTTKRSVKRTQGAYRAGRYGKGYRKKSTRYNYNYKPNYRRTNYGYRRNMR